jgi:hypothetical protein
VSDFGALALAFAHRLIADDAAGAFALLHTQAQAEISPGTLAQRFQGMTGGASTGAEIIETLDIWPAKQPGDLG